MKAIIHGQVWLERILKLIVAFLIVNGVAVLMVSDLQIKNCWFKIALWPFYGVTGGTIRGGCSIIVVSLIMFIPSLLYILKGTIGLYILAVLMMLLWMAGGLSCVTGGA